MTRSSAKFNVRQRALLSYGLRHPSANVSVVSHQNSHQIANNTAKADLQQLVEMGLVLRQRVGKKDVYSFPTGFEGRLRRFRG
jgi:Fic family protein